MPLGSVSIRVNKYLDGARIEYGVPVRFRPVKESSIGRSNDSSRKIIDWVVSVHSSDIASHVELDAGSYDAEAVLPSGEQLTAEFRVKPGKTINVVLRGEDSPNEWRSWWHFASADRISMRRLERERDSSKHTKSRQDFIVTLGQRAIDSNGETSFDVTSWHSWFEYLQARFDKGTESSRHISRLDDNLSNLQVLREGGYDNLPVRISLVNGDFNATAFHAAPAKFGRRRVYVSIAAPSGTRLFALPWPWDTTAEGQSIFDILAVEKDGQLRCDPVLIDERWGGLLAYMSSGRVQLAREILTHARNALFEKFENPLAAAVGGYLLLSNTEGLEDRDWPDWLGNLAHKFPQLPDGAILRAKWLLQCGGRRDTGEAHDLLYDVATRRGIPFFTTGVVWLIEGLMRTSIGCKECEDLLARIRGVARTMDLSQAFTSFDLRTPATRQEALPIRQSDRPTDAATAIAQATGYESQLEPTAAADTPLLPYERLSQS